MPLNRKLYNKLYNLCHFNNFKIEVKNGIIFELEDTNINFIEPHRFIINFKNISLVFEIKYNKVLAETFVKKFEKINNRSMKINIEL